MFQEKKLSKKTDGFTLLEVIIALAIMALAFGSILAIEGDSIRASERMTLISTLTMLARNRMIETEFEIKNKQFDSVQTESAGHFEKPFEEYSWKRTVKKIEFFNFTYLMKTDTISEQDQQMGQFVSKYLNDSLREIVISVRNQDMKGSYDISTYWVDLTKALPL